MAFFVLSSTFHARAQSKHAILRHGPSSNRIDIVLLSEGYTANQLPKFLNDATNAVNQLLSQSPFQEYRTFFNATAIAVASEESGSDHPTWPQFRNTYFNSVFDETKNVVTIPPHVADLNYANGRGKIDMLLRQFGVNADMVVLLVNDLVYGGSGGDVIVVSTHVANDELLLHEAGHTLAGLGDEYSTPSPGFPEIEEPNTTRETRREFIKWKAWIEPETPIPTPANGSFVDKVGLFRGAHYQTSGWYRPQLDCKMRTLGEPFCAVCTEALVLSFHERVRPIERQTPGSFTVALSTNQTVSLTIQLMEAAPASVEVVWYTNGVPVSEAAGTNFTFSGASFPMGNTVVAARVHDRSTFVRNDPKKLTVQVVKWNVVVRDRELLWLHADGRLSAWFLARTNYLGSAPLPAGKKVGTNSIFSGLADFNNDGESDLLWQNKVTGKLAAWSISASEMRGNFPVAPGKSALPWRMGALADFDGDGNVDLLWRNNEGRLAAWFLEGTNFLSGLILREGRPTSTAWRSLAAADFNGDSFPDILWRNRDGRLALWFMNGTELERSEVVLDGKPIGADWRFVALGDFGFGDESPSLLWLHDDGRLKLLRMSGTTNIGSVLLRNGPTRLSGWRPLGMR